MKCGENKKALFLKSYFWSFSSWDNNEQKPKIKRKNRKRNVGRNFEKTTIFCIITEYWHYCGFLVHFHPSFFFFVFVQFFVFDDYFVIYWKTNTITVQKVTICFFDSSHEKIKQRLRWPCQNVEISSSLTSKMWVFLGDLLRMIITMR